MPKPRSSNGTADMNELEIRMADESDVPLILTFIRELADYENLLGEVVATEELLHEWLFEKRKAEVIIGESGGEPVAFALFFHNFSTFLGRAGIYLEDLYRLAVERGCGRLEWWCLDWNKNSIAFYKSLGAEAMDDWTVYRFSGDTLSQLAE